MKTCNLNVWGAVRSAYADRVRKTDGTTVVEIRAYNEDAGHYQPVTELTAGQRRYVIGRTLSRPA